MAWNEIPEKRNQKEKHFFDPDTNHYQAVLTISDQHYFDGSTWLDVDTNFEDYGQNGFDKKCDKTRHAIYVANGGTRRWFPRRNVPAEYVDIIGIQYYTNRWRNLNLPTPVWTNNKTEWDLANLHASITNTWKKIKVDFTLKDNTAPTRLRFEVVFVGLDFNSTTGELKSTTDNLSCGWINSPTAFDANNNPVPINSTYDGVYIEWACDTTSATFPIDIDPTWTDGPGGDVEMAYDVEVQAENPDGTYGSSQYLDIQGDDMAYTHHALLKFSFSGLSGKTLTAGTLYLYQRSASGNSNNYHIHRIMPDNNYWVETDASWNKADSVADQDWAGGNTGCGSAGVDYASTVMGTIAYDGSGTVGQEYAIGLDLTELGSMVATNRGLVGQHHTAWEAAYFASSDHLSVAHPKIVITYTNSVVGSTTWGATTGVEETNKRTFSGNWTGTGVVYGSGDSERIELNVGESMTSEVVEMGAGSQVLIQQNHYGGGTDINLYYRMSSTEAGVSGSPWVSYSGGTLTCDGFIQIKGSA